MKSSLEKEFTTLNSPSPRIRISSPNVRTSVTSLINPSKKILLSANSSAPSVAARSSRISPTPLMSCPPRKSTEASFDWDSTSPISVNVPFSSRPSETLRFKRVGALSVWGENVMSPFATTSVKVAKLEPPEPPSNTVSPLTVAPSSTLNELPDRINSASPRRSIKLVSNVPKTKLKSAAVIMPPTSIVETVEKITSSSAPSPMDTMSVMSGSSPSAKFSASAKLSPDSPINRDVNSASSTFNTCGVASIALPTMSVMPVGSTVMTRLPNGAFANEALAIRPLARTDAMPMSTTSPVSATVTIILSAVIDAGSIGSEKKIDRFAVCGATAAPFSREMLTSSGATSSGIRSKVRTSVVELPPVSKTSTVISAVSPTSAIRGAGKPRSNGADTSLSTTSPFTLTVTLRTCTSSVMIASSEIKLPSSICIPSVSGSRSSTLTTTSSVGATPFTSKGAKLTTCKPPAPSATKAIPLATAMASACPGVSKTLNRSNVFAGSAPF